MKFCLVLIAVIYSDSLTPATEMKIMSKDSWQYEVRWTGRPIWGATVDRTTCRRQHRVLLFRLRRRFEEKVWGETDFTPSIAISIWRRHVKSTVPAPESISYRHDSLLFSDAIWRWYYEVRTVRFSSTQKSSLTAKSSQWQLILGWKYSYTRWSDGRLEKTAYWGAS
jgi:hypothetical protein